MSLSSGQKRPCAQQQSVGSEEDDLDQRAIALKAELAKIEKQKKELAIAKAEAAMVEFYAREPRTMMLIRKIHESLRFGAVFVYDNVYSHLYSPLQNRRFEDVVTVQFYDRNDRPYEIAITASNDGSWKYNRVEMRYVGSRDADSKFPMSVRAMACKNGSSLANDTTFDCDDYELKAEEGTDEYQRGFTTAMLPFDAELNAELAADCTLLTELDLILYTRFREIVEFHCESRDTENDRGDRGLLYNYQLASENLLADNRKYH